MKTQACCSMPLVAVIALKLSDHAKKSLVRNAAVLNIPYIYSAKPASDTVQDKPPTAKR